MITEPHTAESVTRTFHLIGELQNSAFPTSHFRSTPEGQSLERDLISFMQKYAEITKCKL